MKYKVKLRDKEYEVDVETLDILEEPVILDSLEMNKFKGSKILKAEMPGTVISVFVQPGDVVMQGQVLLVLETMKMENEVVSPGDGTIVEVAVKEGMPVTTDYPMVSLK